MITLNESIGILQRTYTRAINLQNNWSGSLFRSDCKAKDGWPDGCITLNDIGKENHRFIQSDRYAYTCMKYIHNNPVSAGLVKESIQWKYSSAENMQ